MRLFAASRTPLVLVAAVLSAASCTAILGISGDFKQAGGGGATGATTSSGGGASSTGSAHAGGSTSAQGAGGTTNSGGGGGTGGDPACTSCLETSCATEIADCVNSDAGPDCKQWYECYTGCGTSACATSCDQMHGTSIALYTPIYQCACSSCFTDGGLGPCGAIKPCDHPCKVGLLYQRPADAGTIYCPFSGVDGGPNLYCIEQTQHCCEPPSTSADCQSVNAPCDAGGSDWHCFDKQDCLDTEVCCTNANATITFAATTECETSGPGVNPFLTGTYCATSCDASQQQLTVCTSSSQCPAPDVCWPVQAHGASFGVCHPK